MKCVCGYHYVSKWELEHSPEQYKDMKLGKEDFTEVEGSFTIQGGDYHRSIRKVYLYACPECKTVQMSD